MNRFILIILSLFFYTTSGNGQENIFENLKNFNFQEIGTPVSNRSTFDSGDLTTLSEIIYWAGQRPDDIQLLNSTGEGTTLSRSIAHLSLGYYDLYHDPFKNDVFKNFTAAYNLSARLQNKPLRKRCLLALLEYYTFEIVQVDESFKKYLTEYTAIASDKADRAWVLYYTIVLGALHPVEVSDDFVEAVVQIDAVLNSLSAKSGIRKKLLFERALALDLDGKPQLAREAYLFAMSEINDEPYLKHVKYACLIKLAYLDYQEENYNASLQRVDEAFAYRDVSDTVRSQFYQSYYKSLALGGKEDFTGAYEKLNTAFTYGYHFDLRNNTLLTNRLNVEFETEKRIEANTNLKKDVARQKEKVLWTFWAGFGILVVVSLGSVLIYKNIKKSEKLAKQQVILEQQSKEKILKEQELNSIDAMIAGQEKERQRIANDLHDNLGSLLATIKLHFRGLKDEREKAINDGYNIVEKTDALIEEAYQKVRQIAHAKNAGVPAQQGLVPAVKNFADKVSLANSLTIEVIDDGMEERLENSVEIILFRIIQELITNVIKHADAREAIIHLTHYGDSINIMVEDDGKGFEIKKIKDAQGMGIHSIQKRVEHMGGTVTVDSAQARGTNIIIDIPVI